MAISTQDEISEAQVPLVLNEFVHASVDYKGRPSLRSKSGRWKSAAFIIVAGVAERFAYFGISSNLVSYLTGSLGLSTATAASLLNAWYGTALLMPILGAFVADSFCGRYWMIIGACVPYVLGLGFLSISASHTECKISPENNTRCSPPEIQIIFFFISLFLVAIAQGGYTPCIQAFGAEQFDDEHKNECKEQSSFFNWSCWFSLGGTMVPLLVLTYIQDNLGWEIGFGIPAIVMFLTFNLFLVGTPTYRFRVNSSNGQNPFVRIFQVFIKAARNWRAAPEAISNEKATFLDKALVSSDGSIEDGNFCSIRDVEDTKSLLRLIPIWFTALGYSIVFAQPSTLFTKQAGTLDRHITSTFQIPAASLQQCYITCSLIICIPIYDRVLVPIARSITKKPSGISMLQRIGIGLVISLLSMVFAAIIERKRLALAVDYKLVDFPNAIIPMSVWWLAPQYILHGVSDVFAMIGLQEFFYNQIPDDLKSLGLAMYLSILGVGSFLSSFLVTFIDNLTKVDDREGWFADNLNRAHLDYFYWLLAGLCTLELAAYVYFTSSYVYRRRISV